MGLGFRVSRLWDSVEMIVFQSFPDLHIRFQSDLVLGSSILLTTLDDINPYHYLIRTLNYRNYGYTPSYDYCIDP